MCLADGGNYENTGLLPLLQRGLGRVVCFINSAFPLDLNFKKDVFSNEPTADGEMVKEVPAGHSYLNEEYYCADTQLLALFGAVKVISLSYNFTTATVFERSRLNDVMFGLIESVKAGKGAVTKQKLKVLENRDWNIKGGYDVDVLFVYNEHCHNFMNRLPEDTRKVLDDPDGGFGDFPFYRTTFQNDRIFSLQLEEVNLIAAQAEFVLKENKKLLSSMFE